jgi:hypothetical protein
MDTFLPARLVDASPDDCRDGVRLTLSKHILDRETKYAALSHSWGLKEQRIKPMPKTKKDSIRDRLEYIPFAELTKTFQDAVTTARQLGLKYVWIDSLCIIQDDPDDFAEQASQMAKIYGRAYLVISALRAATGDVGIFHRRPAAQQAISTVKGRPALTAFVRPALYHDDFITGQPRNFRASPLFARAWCFQERLLASRVVHFSETELVWEYNQQLDCECRAVSSDALAEHNDNFKRRQALALQDARMETRLNAWCDVVRAYTARSLTVESDRLPALSGFAQLVSTSELGRYCAGLWEGQMPAALLWRPLSALPEAENQTVERPEGYQAPTWAWPAVRGVIEGYIRYVKTSEVVARVVDIVCEPATNDRFGQVRKGHLVLQAPVVEAVLQPVQEDDGEQHAYSLEKDGEMFRFQAMLPWEKALMTTCLSERWCFASSLSAFKTMSMQIELRASSCGMLMENSSKMITGIGSGFSTVHNIGFVRPGVHG